MADIQLPLRAGTVGDGIRDLQGLLEVAGFPVDSEETGSFGPSTGRAVLAFQSSRGLEGDGTVGDATWAALIEAGHHLGDRLLCLRTPMMRGDDVAELQILLGSLGFDTDKVDGIFGLLTQHAVGDFQRSVGLVADDVCGPDTIDALRRIRSRGGSTSVAFVREREELFSHAHSLDALKVVCVHDGTFRSLCDALAQRLESVGSSQIVFEGPDRSELARRVNDEGGDLVIGFRSGVSPELRVAYFESSGYTSEGGRALASLIANEMPRIPGIVGARVQGMRLPLLRETRCVATELTIGQTPPTGDAELAVINGLQRALERWVG